MQQQQREEKKNKYNNKSSSKQLNRQTHAYSLTRDHHRQSLSASAASVSVAYTHNIYTNKLNEHCMIILIQTMTVSELRKSGLFTRRKCVLFGSCISSQLISSAVFWVKNACFIHWITFSSNFPLIDDASAFSSGFFFCCCCCSHSGFIRWVVFWWKPRAKCHPKSG